MKRLISIFLFIIYTSASAQNNAGLIPMPQKYEQGKGVFKLNSQTSISGNQKALKNIAHYFKNEVLKLKGISIKEKASSANIVLKLVKDKKNPEGYDLKVSPEQIVISAGSASGIFYGVIALLQMAVNSKNTEIAACTITDSPAYAWRGLLLDESRHFFGKEKVKSILNWMAFYKLNTFHWHLTDEPAWRLEIKKYPKLGVIGGTGDYLNPDLPAQYYTQTDVEEIVAYAAARYIKVIPEIDMPGHATAANRAYPQYSGGGSVGHPDFTFNPGNENTYSYLSEILKETNALFPAKMIHLGGDEVSYGNEKWKTDPSILRLKREYNLKDDIAVERYFMKRMADSVYHLNTKVLVWDEMADADLPNDKTIMFWWRQDKPKQLATALNKGYQTVLCPRLPLYFDFVQDSTHRYGRKWNKRYNPVEQVYHFDAAQFAENSNQRRNILGIQANLWTETVSDEKRLDYLLFPRLAALAEAAWTNKEAKNFEAFQNALKKHILLYNANKIYYYDPFGNSNAEPSVQKSNKNYLDKPE